MLHHRPRPTTILAALWEASAPLTAAGLLLMGALLVSLAGLWLDPRAIAGAPAWLKPAKFAVSTATFSFTFAWILSYLPARPRTRSLVGWVSATTLVLEVALIDLQAWRGTTSHFNVGTTADAAIWSAMATAITLQTMASVVMAAAVWRSRFVDPALGRAIRLGLTISIVGAASGGMMTAPTAAQLATVRATGHMPVVGAHTVGAPDGGPGLPGIGWSREHGDLRAPHFIGLHAIHVLPLFAFGLRRHGTQDRLRVRLVAVAAASYAMLFGILLWQSLRGQPLVHPDSTTIVVLAAWAAVTTAVGLGAAGKSALDRVHRVAC